MNWELEKTKFKKLVNGKNQTWQLYLGAGFLATEPTTRLMLSRKLTQTNTTWQAGTKRSTSNFMDLQLCKRQTRFEKKLRTLWFYGESKLLGHDVTGILRTR